MTPVAIKQYFDSEAFIREYAFYKRATKIGTHPGLLSVLGVFSYEGNSCLVTEFC